MICPNSFFRPGNISVTMFIWYKKVLFYFLHQRYVWMNKKCLDAERFVVSPNSMWKLVKLNTFTYSVVYLFCHQKFSNSIITLKLFKFFIHSWKITNTETFLIRDLKCAYIDMKIYQCHRNIPFLHKNKGIIICQIFWFIVSDILSKQYKIWLMLLNNECTNSTGI